LTVKITIETTQIPPLTLTDEGIIRITGSRVSIDSIIHHYKLGATAEQIAYKFQGLRLADIHAAIAYYLSHREVIEEYLRTQEAKGDALRHRLESDPSYQAAMLEMRERLLARWAARQQETLTLPTV
jgi:uncharacterized protein (DUF433 family)